LIVCSVLCFECLDDQEKEVEAEQQPSAVATEAAATGNVATGGGAADAAASPKTPPRGFEVVFAEGTPPDQIEKITAILKGIKLFKGRGDNAFDLTEEEEAVATGFVATEAVPMGLSAI
jgi:hypothetical protein